MVQPQYYDVRANMLTTFISTLVAILVAVPVAMFVASTLIKSQAASASTYSQNAQVGPAGSLVSTGNACVAPSSSTESAQAGAEASASSQGANVWGGSGGGVGFLSAIYQNQTENNSSTTNYTDSFNTVVTSVDASNTDNSINDSFNDNSITQTTTTVTTVTDNSVTDSNNVTDNSLQNVGNTTDSNNLTDNSVTQTTGDVGDGSIGGNVYIPSLVL